jgi:hypothetical protein
LNDPIISHASLLWFCENDPRVREPEGGLARPHGETFVMRQGDVLVALDDAGRGQMRLIDDQPWRRAYVVPKPGARDSFVPKSK